MYTDVYLGSVITTSANVRSAEDFFISENTVAGILLAVEEFLECFVTVVDGAGLPSLFL